MIVVSEAFLLAEKLGLDAQRLFDIASKSSGQCWSMTSYCPVPGPVPTSPANRDYQAGFTAAMMLKDLKLAQAAARATRATTPLGAGAAAVYERFVESERRQRRFFRHHSLPARALNNLPRRRTASGSLAHDGGTPDVTRSEREVPDAVTASIDRSPFQINLIFIVLLKPILDPAA